MDTLNLQQLSLILDQELIILQEDVQKDLLTKKFATNQSLVVKEEINSEDKVNNSQLREDDRDEISQVNYEGSFAKGVLVVFEGNSLQNSHREFLFKILGAVGCSLKDVALVSSLHIQELPSQSLYQLNPNKCLVFGTLNHPVMQRKTANYTIISGETIYFFADRLEDLAENVQLKRSLWDGLQVLFQIKK